MNRKNLLIFLLIASTTLCFAQKKVCSVELKNLNNDERIALFALQGLANRVECNIFIEPGTEGCFYPGGYATQKNNHAADGRSFISAKTLSDFPNLENVWQKYYSGKNQISFVRTSFPEVLKHFDGLIKGLVMYNAENKNSELTVAVTLCGLYSVLPVTPALLQKYPTLKKKLFMDLRDKFQSKHEAQEWSVNQLLNKTNRKYAYSYWAKENNCFSIDYAVANKLFAFDLSFRSPKVHLNGDGKECGFDSIDARLMNRIFAHLKPASTILGWGTDYEYIIQARCGEGGHALICTNVSPNLSFHAAVKAKNTAGLKQKTVPDKMSRKPENKIYITFSINEGDTYKSVGNLMNDGAWLHEKRGKVPFNWPVNPRLLQMLPGLASFYYDQMTEKDYFYVSTSGIGYFDSSFSTPQQRDTYALENKKSAAYADMHYIDVWWNNFKGNDNWIKNMGMKGCTLWKGQQRVDFSKAIPCIESEIYYMKGDAAKFADYIRQQTAEIKDSPWFVHVYACDPEKAYQIMQLLDSSRFEAVCMDEFFQLAIQARPIIEGKSIAKNKQLFGK